MAASGAIYQAQVRAFSGMTVPDQVMDVHHEAMACRDIEDAIDVGIRVYEMLNSYDVQTRRRAADGVGISDEEWDQIDAEFDRWLATAQDWLKLAKWAKSRRYDVKQFERFAALVEQCQAAKDDR